METRGAYCVPRFSSALSIERGAKSWVKAELIKLRGGRTEGKKKTGAELRNRSS